MDKRDKKIDQIIAHLASAATAAADGVSDAVQSAGNVVSDKYDSVRLTLELNRLQDEQNKLFNGIGRTLYLIKSGDIAASDVEDTGSIDAQKTIDRFLLLADQKQQELDHISERLAKINGAQICAVCGKVSDGKDAFCAACGAKLGND